MCGYMWIPTQAMPDLATSPSTPLTTSGQPEEQIPAGPSSHQVSHTTKPRQGEPPWGHTLSRTRVSMSMSCRSNSCRGRLSSYSHSQAVQREATVAALHCSSQWRGGVAAGSGAFRQSGSDQPGAQAAGGRGQVGADRQWRLRQSCTRPAFGPADGTSAPGGLGRRNLRSAGHCLAAGSSAAALQLRCHHPGALAHHIRYRPTAHQPLAADRQASGGV